MPKTVAKKIKHMKRSKEFRIISFIVVFLIAAIAYFFTSNNDEEITYSSSQNDQGYYYYVESTSTSNYYYEANDLIGIQLENKLKDIITNNFQPVSYNDARVWLAESDLSIDDPTKVRNIYDDTLVDATWDSYSWHREHVWPQSRLGLEDPDGVSGSDKNAASDLHNLRAITPSVNSTRSNRFYSEGSGDYTITTDSGFYPGDNNIGDVARIVLYMVVMYDQLTLTDDVDMLNAIDEYAYELEGAYMGVLSTLLAWNKLDPVDAFERQRNDVIYSAQGNRNPFIDHPEYVHLIWEDKTIADLTKLADANITTPDTQLIVILNESKRYELI